MNRYDCTPQEQWVLEQLEKGKIADLKKQFGEAESDRRLRVRFLEDLFTDDITENAEKFKPHRRGIRITYAVVGEPLILEKAEVFHNVILQSCVFEKKVTFRDASFARHLFLNDCRFPQEVDFHRLNVRLDLYCRETIFQGLVNFDSAAIGRQFNANGAKFENVDQKANFNGLKVGQDAIFKSTVFQGPVDFGHANIAGQMAAQEARFLAMEKEANFNAIKVGQEASFQGAEFTGPVDLSLAQIESSFDISPLEKNGGRKPTIFKKAMSFAGTVIGGQLLAEESQFLSETQNANFNGLKVGQSAFFDNAVFKGPVNFGSAFISGQFNATGAHFEGQGKENKSSFNALNIGQDAFFNKAVYRGQVNFENANIGRCLVFEEASFQGQGRDNLVSFNGMKVGQDAFFQNAIFHGPVDFGGANIGRQFICKRARFVGQDEENQASFNPMRVGHNAYFDQAFFQWPVDFSGMQTDRQFSADEAEFHYADSLVLFHRLEVNQDAYFRGTSFQGGVDFTMMRISGSFYLDPFQERDKLKQTTLMGIVRFGGSHIGGQLVANEASFGEPGEDHVTSFNGLTVGQEVFFRQTKFQGSVHICYAHLLDLILNGNPEISDLLMENTQISRRLEVSQTNINKLQARNLEVKGTANLSKVNIFTEADLQDSAFQTLKFEEVNWPQRQNGNEPILLDGLNFQSLDAGGWQMVLNWLEASRFNSQTYSHVEAYMRHIGLTTWANKVFIASKRREVSQLPWWKKWPTRLFWGGLVGYGRKPYLTLPWIIFFVAIGALVFSLDFTSKGMESQPYLKLMVGDYPVFSKIILSLDRFLPGVDLGVAKHWAPQNICFWSWIYWYVQKLLGWVLIPIALAAIYTRIK